MLKLPVYLDYHATTPVDPRVLEAMLPFFTDDGRRDRLRDRQGRQRGDAQRELLPLYDLES